MRPLSSRELLDVWEHGQMLSAQSRALLLLRAAAPDVSAEELANLPIGERDRRLFRLREWAFGSRLPSLATCRRCALLVEFDEDVARLCSDEHPALPARLQLQADGCDVEFRLPTAGDLAAIEPYSDLEIAERHLLERCVISFGRDGCDLPLSELSQSMALAISDRMSSADSQADLGLLLTCPGCGLEWRELFDIASFFWSEIDAWAVRLLHAVHTLASAYGWREDDIVALSPWRRQLYLEMASG